MMGFLGSRVSLGITDLMAKQSPLYIVMIMCRKSYAEKVQGTMYTEYCRMMKELYGKFSLSLLPTARCF